jgi:hypothetical protein
MVTVIVPRSFKNQHAERRMKNAARVVNNKPIGSGDLGSVQRDREATAVTFGDTVEGRGSGDGP